MADSELHMLAYWVEDQGVEDAFEHHYPELAQKDQVIREALQQRRTATYALMARVKEISENAELPND